MYHFHGLEMASANIVWDTMEHNYIFEWLLGLLSICTWIKLLFRMQMTELFGPQFKIVSQMMVDLARFYMIWAVILLSLTSLCCLVFMEVPEYHNFGTALNMHFDWALGAFDSSIYCTEDLPGEICIEGKVFLFVFNTLNVVTLLNLLIAIMGSVYGMFEDKQQGLYYEVLVGKFTTMEYEDRYGAGVVGAPWNIMVLPFQWILIFDCWSDDFLRSYNDFLCHLLYLPVALLNIGFFIIMNSISAPLAYFKLLYSLTRRVCKMKKASDNESESNICTKLLTVFKFLLFGPIVLAVSIPVDCFVYIYNLFSVPAKDELSSDVLLTEECLQIFLECVEEALKENASKKKSSPEVNFVSLNKIIQKKLKVINSVTDLVFKSGNRAEFENRLD